MVRQIAPCAIGVLDCLIRSELSRVKRRRSERRPERIEADRRNNGYCAREKECHCAAAYKLRL
jgi:hypothetical protein